MKRGRQRGTVTAEFSLVSLIFFTFMFAVMEMARAVYLLNTLQEVSRRAAALAAVTDFSDPAAMAAVRQQAVFRDTPGALLLGDPITDAYVHIDYLSLAYNSGGGLALTPIPTASLPACVARQRLNCTTDPNGGSCIRFVRVRLCAPGSADGACNPIQYQTLVPLVSFAATLPVSTTIVRAESLGMRPGSPMCP
jgi:hypothetical protein